MARKIIVEDEPFIDDELNDRVNWVVDDVILHDETFKTWEHDLDKCPYLLLKLGTYDSLLIAPRDR